MNLLSCFVCLCFTGLHTRYHTDLEQMLKKNAKIFVTMDTECWIVLVK